MKDPTDTSAALLKDKCFALQRMDFDERVNNINSVDKIPFNIVQGVRNGANFSRQSNISKNFGRITGDNLGSFDSSKYSSGYTKVT